MAPYLRVRDGRAAGWVHGGRGQRASASGWLVSRDHQGGLAKTGWRKWLKDSGQYDMMRCACRVFSVRLQMVRLGRKWGAVRAPKESVRAAGGGRGRTEGTCHLLTFMQCPNSLRAQALVPLTGS